MNFTKNIGMLLLAIYLILVGLVTLLGLGVGYIALWWMEGRHLDRLSRSIGKSDAGTS